ncbi:hypothetical protein FRB90_009211, partial [Tulasnella sp. 427]
IIAIQHGFSDDPEVPYYSRLVHFGDMVPQLHYTWDGIRPQLMLGDNEDVETMLGVAIEDVTEET